MLYHNFIFLTKLTGEKLKNILLDLNLTNAALTKWKRGGGVRDNTLSYISEYFSKKLDLPIDIFNSGEALLGEDFKSKIENYLQQAQSLRNDKSYYPNIQINEAMDNYDTDSPTPHERKLLTFIRSEIGGIPSKATIERIIRYLHYTGIDSDYMFSFIKNAELIQEKGLPPYANPTKEQSRAIKEIQNKITKDNK